MREMTRDATTVRIHGVETRIYDTGARPGRPTIIMVHGGDPRSLSNGLDWSTIWAPEAIGARLIAYDKPGQGYSYQPGMTAQTATLPELEAHLADIVADVKDSPVILMGHSRGALPAARVALAHQEQLAGLVLVSSNTLAPESDATPKDFYPTAYANPPDELDHVYARREPEMNSATTGHIDDAFVRGRIQAARETGWWRDRPHRLAMYPAVLDSLTHGRAEVLRQLRGTELSMPVLQLWGAADVSAPVGLAHELHRLLSRRSPDVTSVVLSSSAHYVYRERPHAFLAQLRALLELL